MAKTAEAEGPRVMFVAAKGSPFASRVRAEIEAMGFAVADSPSLDASGGTDVVAVARVFEAPPPKRVELWLSVGPTHELALKTTVQPAAGDDDATQTVRASEQLRAFFQPLRPASARPAELAIVAIPVPRPAWADLPAPSASPLPATPAPGIIPASAPTTASDKGSSKETRSYVALDGGIGVATLPGGAGADVELGARWLALPWLAAGVRLAAPITPGTIDDPVGTARTSAFRAEVSAELVYCQACRFRFTGGLEGGFAWVRVSGFSITQGSSGGDATAPLFGATAELAPRLVNHLRVAVRGELLVASTAVNVAFQSRQVATFGRPLGVVSLGPSFEF